MADRVRKLTDHLSSCPVRSSRRTSKTLSNKIQQIRPQPVAAGVARYTKREILKKREKGECYIVIHGKVYDVTEFLEEHPGGAEIITDIDAADFETQTVEFDEAEHSDEALEDLEEYYKGVFVEDEDSADDEKIGSDEEVEAVEEEVHEVMLELTDEQKRTPFAFKQEAELELIDSYQISKDVIVYRFALEDPAHKLGLPIGQHIILNFKNADGTVISRPYTPVSPYGETGFIDFLVKLYPTGKMSNYLQSLSYGDKVHMKGPKGHVQYFGNGKFIVKNEQRLLRRVGMIAGGSGITPMFQILQAVADNADDHLEINLLFANKTCEDILLRSILERFTATRKNIKIAYTLDNPPEGWPYYSGFITEQMIRAVFPPPSEDSMIFLCGPPPMIKKACIPNLKALGYRFKKDYYSF